MTRDQLAKVPWLDHASVGARVVHLMPVWDGERWCDWIPAADGRVVEIHPIDLGRGHYLAHAEARETDLHFSFVEIIWQHLSFPPVARATSAIDDDMCNLGTSLAKIDFFWKHRAEVGHGIGEFVRTEVEYMLVVARSTLDHLHEVIHGVWDTIVLLDEEQQRAKKQRGLPKKLSRTCLDGASVRPAHELVSKHALPQPVADAYERVGSHLREVRSLRDGIVHLGDSHGPVFVTERGFGIGRHDALARAVPTLWRDEHTFNENVVSLRPMLAHVAIGTLYVCEAVTRAFASCIQLPPPIAPGYRVFSRAEHAAALLHAQEVLRGADAWWSPGAPATP